MSAGSRLKSACKSARRKGYKRNGWIVVLSRAGRGDANRGSETSAPVEDGFGEMGVYVPSFRARYSARHSQQRKCVAFERGARGSGLE